jgi:glycosyltransferase involved in cell wall biosynthesis
MTIAVDIREWQPGQYTGIGRFLEEFLRAAIEVRPLDRFLLIGDATCEVRVQGRNVDVVRIPERWTLWWDQVVLPRALVRGGADVFYSPYIKAPIFTAIPIVSTIHDLTFFLLEEYTQTPIDKVINGLFRIFCKSVVKRAVAIIVDSQTSARDVQQMLGAPPAKVRVIPLATSLQFRPNGDRLCDAEVLKRYALTDGYVLYVGGFNPHKNVPSLVRAHSALPQPLRVRCPLVLVGGPVPYELQCLSQAPEVAAGVRCLGVVPEVDLPSLYRGAALFAFPSRYEGFGLPVLEAMACGIPILCSTATALVELAGGAAVHIDPEDNRGWERALKSLLEDDTHREKLAALGRARSARYNSERMAGEILMVLDEAAACRRSVIRQGNDVANHS